MAKDGNHCKGMVNDGSTDHTSAVSRETQHAAVIDLPVNLGIGDAMQTGFIYASRNGYDIAVQIDADGQHDPRALSHIIDPIVSRKVDCCIGSRFLTKTLVISKLHSKLTRLIQEVALLQEQLRAKGSK